jgi:hypothetical protein
MVRRYATATHTGIAAAWVAATAVTGAPAGAAAQHSAIEHRSWQASHIALAGAFAVALWIDATQTREAVRRWLLWGALAVEALAIRSNTRAGLAVKFP